MGQKQNIVFLSLHTVMEIHIHCTQYIFDESDKNKDKAILKDISDIKFTKLEALFLYRD